jgi:hypothetical protein
VIAPRLTARWVEWYTRGLPDVVRDERRGEIASDLWEHGAIAGDGARAELAILSRLARGMPADLSWRRSRRHVTRRGLARAVRGLGWAIAAVAYLFMVGNFAWSATPLVGLDLYGEDWPPGDVELYARISGTLFLLLVAGVALIGWYPRTGAAVVVAALVVTPVVFWWAAPIYVPLGLAVAVAAVTLARRSRARRAEPTGST